ncbi:MAG: tyrosine-protein phosphatase [Candidatus Schekmanbacteria bacterium]|nr:MAG: tyrosine-protein phosphatase [Candidatus Schekmanbacteria bacterium]
MVNIRKFAFLKKKGLIVPIIFLFFLSCASQEVKKVDVNNVSENKKPKRIIMLDGARNFRDIGGYETKDGQTVKWREIFRSDALSNLSTYDFKKINEFGIKLVIDFRTESEAKNSPTIWQGDSPPRIINLPIGSASEEWAQKLTEQLKTGNFTAEEIRNTFIMAYKSIPIDSADVYKKMFELLINPDNRPAIIHCRSGKDRTGIASALIFSALGVPRDTIIEDFMLTNKASSVDEILPFIAEQFSKQAGRKVSPEDIRPLIGVEEGYIQAMFEGIEENYGTMDNYLEKALGLTPEKRKRLKEELLEKEE